jgi:hypothetical protein
MISVKVTYTVKPAFLVQNKENINLFLADFKKLVTANFFYNVFIEADGLTFIHISMYENESVQQQVIGVPSFLKFQEERDANGLDVVQKVENLEFVGSSLSLLN